MKTPRQECSGVAWSYSSAHGIRYLLGEKALKTKLTPRFTTFRFSTHYRRKATEEVQREWKDQF